MPERTTALTVVAKIGTSSVTSAAGDVDVGAVAKLCAEVAQARHAGHRVVVVTSGAVTAGVAAMRPPAGTLPGRPNDPITLQALSGIGQHRLMRVYEDALAAHRLIAAQVLLAPLDFMHRQQYLHARSTIERMLDLGVVPVVNENDAVADDEIRFGDNDHLAALVAHLLRADLLVLLTDTPGLLSADPRTDGSATLIEEVTSGQQVGTLARRPGTAGSSGGMASKVAAATMAAWSGVPAVIAAARRPEVLAAAIAGEPGTGTRFPAEDRRLPARKLWIAFAARPKGGLSVDDGARRAVIERGTSLLPAGVTAVEGSFDLDDPVEIRGPDGVVFARGLARVPAGRAAEWLGRQTSDLPGDLAPEVVHRDDLVVVKYPEEEVS
jgi:glutamate 5-kinase